MSSDNKIAANRTNAKKSTGPRSTQGKSRARGNAWCHGWAVVKRDDCTISVDVERMAKAICGDNITPALYEQAVIIAECQILILKLRAAQIAAIERNRIAAPKPEKSNQLPGLPTTEEWAVALAALERGQPRSATKLFGRAARAIRAADRRLAKTEAKSTGSASCVRSSQLPMTISDAAAERMREEQSIPRRQDDVRALQRALPELASLDRYERRALSRRNRAIRMLEAILIVAPFLDRKTKDI